MAGLGIPDYSVAPVAALRWLLPSALRLAGRTNVNPARIYDCSKITGLGLRKPVPFDRGLADFIAWYRGRAAGVAAP
jgi:nucleoside-diphosphate-sugar epimerase